MKSKVFAQRLHQQLDEIGVPTAEMERIKAVSKMFKLHEAKVEQILLGHIPDEKILLLLANEFEVSTQWLKGEV